MVEAFFSSTISPLIWFLAYEPNEYSSRSSHIHTATIETATDLSHGQLNRTHDRDRGGEPRGNLSQTPNLEFRNKEELLPAFYHELRQMAAWRTENRDDYELRNQLPLSVKAESGGIKVTVYGISLQL